MQYPIQLLAYSIICRIFHGSNLSLRLDFARDFLNKPFPETLKIPAKITSMFPLYVCSSASNRALALARAINLGNEEVFLCHERF